MLLLATLDVRACFSRRMIELTKNIPGLNWPLCRYINVPGWCYHFMVPYFLPENKNPRDKILNHETRTETLQWNTYSGKSVQKLNLFHCIRPSKSAPKKYSLQALLEEERRFSHWDTSVSREDYNICIHFQRFGKRLHHTQRCPQW